MQFTKKRRVKKTTKRMTLSRRGQKRGGEFSLFKKPTQPTQTLCITNNICTKNNLLLLSEAITKFDENPTMFGRYKLNRVLNNVLADMREVKTKEELGKVLGIIRDDIHLLYFFTGKKGKKNQDKFIKSISVIKGKDKLGNDVDITPRILQIAFKKMLDKIINLSRHIAEEEEKIKDTRRRIRKRSMVLPDSEVAEEQIKNKNPPTTFEP